MQEQFDKANIMGYGMRNPNFDSELPGINQHTDSIRRDDFQEDISFKNDTA